MEMKIRLDPATTKRLLKEFADVEKQIPKIEAQAVNDTAKQTQTAIARGISKRVMIKVGDAKRHIRRTKATAANPNAAVVLSESQRITLRQFGAKQIRRGVSYKIARDQPRQTIKSAFGPNIDKLNNQVFVRRDKRRLPIDGPKRGPSPWGVFVMSDLEPEVLQLSGEQLEKNMERRLNVALLRRQGKI